MNFHQTLVYMCLVFYSAQGLTSVPKEVTLSGIVYTKVYENVIGNHKSSEYVKAGETLNNWTSKVAIHFFMDESDPVKYAQDKFGNSSKIELVANDKNNILQTFDTMNTQGEQGDPIIFQQNIWRYQKLNYGKGIIAVEYTVSKIISNQTPPGTIEGIGQTVQDEIKALPIERYEF